MAVDVLQSLSGPFISNTVDAAFSAAHFHGPTPLVQALILRNGRPPFRSVRNPMPNILITVSENEAPGVFFAPLFPLEALDEEQRPASSTCVHSYASTKQSNIARGLT
jgi:hypothetical protein